MPFSLLIGQKLAKDILQNALKSGRVAQGYLFHGPEGVGKETAARAFAQALNCLSPGPGPDACGQCASCIKIARYEHPDIQLVFPIPKEFVEGGNEDPDAELSNKAAAAFAKLYEEKRDDAGYKFPFGQKPASIRILQIRALIQSLRFRPHEGKKRLFIFLKADRLTIPAAQAFLKTLEEPEANTIFILLTETPQALLPTILSRCQKVRFAPLTRKDIVEALRLRLGLSPEKARTFAALAHGSLGRALALADGEKDGFQAERDLAKQLFDSAARGSSPFSSARSLAWSKDRNKAERVIDFLELWLRDLLVFKEQGEEALVNLDRLPEIRASHAGWEQGKLEQAIAACEDIKAGIRANANLHLALTVLLQRLSRIQRGLAPIPPGLFAWPFMLKS